MGKHDDHVEEKEAPIKALDETDIAFLKNYGLGPYAAPIKRVEEDIKSVLKKVNDVCGIKESDTGLAPPSRWDLVSDKQMMQVCCVVGRVAVCDRGVLRGKERRRRHAAAWRARVARRALTAPSPFHHNHPQQQPHRRSSRCRSRAAPRSSTPTPTTPSTSST